ALANAFADGVAPKDEKRHVGPELQADFAEPGTAEVQFPQAIEDQQDRRRIRRAPAEPAADGEVLFEPQLGPAPGARFTPQKPRRPDAEVFFAERPLEAHIAVRARSDAYAVAAVDQAKDGLQLVVAVRSQAEQVQEQIQLPRRRVRSEEHTSELQS